jgi:curved DNA-binding protein CbpA
MANPYSILGATPTDGDEAIRRHYVDAVRRSPPERCPEQFARIREAYERIKDENARLEFLLFDATQGESIDELIEEERCRTAPKRVGLAALLSLLGEAR